MNTGVAVQATDSLSTLKDKGVAWVEIDGTTIVAAYRQVSSINQNPIIFRFDDGAFTWVRSDNETSAADGRARGILYDGQRLIVACTVDGAQL